MKPFQNVVAIERVKHGFEFFVALTEGVQAVHLVRFDEIAQLRNDAPHSETAKAKLGAIIKQLLLHGETL